VIKPVRIVALQILMANKENLKRLIHYQHHPI